MNAVRIDVSLCVSVMYAMKSTVSVVSYKFIGYELLNGGKVIVDQLNKDKRKIRKYARKKRTVFKITANAASPNKIFNTFTALSSLICSCDVCSHNYCTV